MSTLLLSVVTGFASGMLLVLVASGLALTFGTMRIANMAHGGFFMLGAFLAYSFVKLLPSSIGGLEALVLASLAVLGIGTVAEILVYRRIYNLPHLNSLLGLFALMAFIQASVEFIWGTNPLFVNVDLGPLNGVLTLARGAIPVYYLVILGVGLVVCLALAIAIRYTEIGLQTRAIAHDREMAALLGIRTKRVFRVALGVGMFLAGLAGALIAPTRAIDSSLGADYIILAFAVVVVGGMDSVLGTVISGLGLGLVNSLATTYFPILSGYSIYLAMVLVLVFRPTGLLGRVADVKL